MGFTDSEEEEKELDDWSFPFLMMKWELYQSFDEPEESESDDDERWAYRSLFRSISYGLQTTEGTGGLIGWRDFICIDNLPL